MSAGLYINATCPVTKGKSNKQKKQPFKWDNEANTPTRSFISAQESYLTTGQEIHKKQMIEQKKDHDLKIKQLRRETTA